MTGKELIEIIERNGLRNAPVIIGAQGYVNDEVYVEINENRICIVDGCYYDWNELEDEIESLKEFRGNENDC